MTSKNSTDRASCGRQQWDRSELWYVLLEAAKFFYDNWPNSTDTARGVWKRFADFLSNPKLHLDCYLLAAYFRSCYIPEMAFVQSADLKFPDSPHYKARKMAFFWSAFTLKLRDFVVDSAWETHDAFRQYVGALRQYIDGDDSQDWPQDADTRREDAFTSLRQLESGLQTAHSVVQNKATPWLTRNFFFAAVDDGSFGAMACDIVSCMSLDGLYTVLDQFSLFKRRL